MARKIYDLAVAVGSYVTKEGQQRNRYQNVGIVMEKDDGGKFILLERWFNPAGTSHDASKGNSIIVSMFEPRQDGQAQGSAAPASTSDEIPF